MRYRATGRAEDQLAFSAKRLAATAITVAIMIGAQFVFSFVPGVELVSLVLCVFCVVFGPLNGVIAALAFSLLRVIIFGFAPNVIVIYLVYYPAFALATGFYGRLIKRAWQGGADGWAEDENSRKCAKKGTFSVCVIGLTLLVAALTCTFTLLDDAISPLVMGFGKNSALIYFYRSLPVMLTHTISAGASVAVLFFPVWRVMEKIKRSMGV